MVWLGSKLSSEGMGGKGSLAGVEACAAGVASRCRGVGVGALNAEGGMHEVSFFAMEPSGAYFRSMSSRCPPSGR